MGGKPNNQTAPDMRKAENKATYGTVENRDKTAPRGKLNTGKPAPKAATAQPTAILPAMIPVRPTPPKAPSKKGS